MAYDERLAARIRDLIGDDPALTEQRMFGGLGFLIHGNLAIAASGQGGVLVRVGAERADHLVDTTKAEIAIMRDRPMAGWLRVASEYLRTKRDLGKWVDLGTDYARTLAPKAK